MYMAVTVSDEGIQKGLLSGVIKECSHGIPQIWVTGMLAYLTILFISISEYVIFSSNFIVILSLFQVNLEANKILGDFKKGISHE